MVQYAFQKYVDKVAKPIVNNQEMTTMYYGHDMQGVMLQPLNLMSKMSHRFFTNPYIPVSQTSMGRYGAANSAVAERLTHIYTKPTFGIEKILSSKGTVYQIEEEVILKKTFCNLIHFKKKQVIKDGKSRSASNPGPKVLIVAPYSGHYATLLRDTVRSMLIDHDVYITDWDNARDVPLYKGKFNLDDYISYLIEFMELLGEKVHVIAVCQPSVPVMVMAALMNEAKNPCRPQSMILMGGPIDTRASPTKVNKLSKERPFEWFERNVVAQVPHYYPGAFRRVIPGFIMLAGFMNLNLEKHITAPRTLFNHMVKGDDDSADGHKVFYDEYRAVLDLPADYFLDCIHMVFKEHLLPKNQFVYKGHKVDLNAITQTALMTVEGEKDDISGVGQTKAAHDICPNIPQNMRNHHLQMGVGHYGVFNGRRWRESTTPKITAFIKENNA